MTTTEEAEGTFGKAEGILRRIAYPRWPFDSTDPEHTVRTG